LHDVHIRKFLIKALIKAVAFTKCKDLTILTWEEEGVEHIDDHKIKIIPIWKWLLSIGEKEPA
jgi:predicted AAA+ superfamily ATPase